MKIIENITPLKLNGDVDKIIVNYTVASPSTYEKGTSYVTAPIDFDKEKTQRGLKILKKFGYIKNFTEMLYISRSGKYKEEGFHKPIEIKGDALNKTLRRVQYKIYHFPNNKKWNFLQGRRFEPDIALNIDEEKINKILSGYRVGDIGVGNLIKKLQIDYSEYFTDIENLNTDILQDFLYFFAYIYKSEFKKIDIKSYVDIVFDEASGKIYTDNQLLGTIGLGTREFSFFEYLYKNRGKFISHDNLVDYITAGNKIEKTTSGYCSDVKRLLPIAIRGLIRAPKGGYLIP